MGGILYKDTFVLHILLILLTTNWIKFVYFLCILILLGLIYFEHHIQLINQSIPL